MKLQVSHFFTLEITHLVYFVLKTRRLQTSVESQYVWFVAMIRPLSLVSE